MQHGPRCLPAGCSSRSARIGCGMMRRIAVLGASGFIGNRIVEIFQRDGEVEVRPVVQRASRAALPRRFDLPVQIADALDMKSLTPAFEGVDSVIMAIAGDPTTIVRSVEPVYRAAMKSNVRRLIYLSSASVHGQAPALGVDETTPLSKQQPIAYNNAKVVAEQQLWKLRKIGRVESRHIAAWHCLWAAVTMDRWCRRRDSEWRGLPYRRWLGRLQFDLCGQSCPCDQISTICADC